MSGILWSRRPSDGSVASIGGSSHGPRTRTTSGGKGVISSVLVGLSKAKSKERLRNNGTPPMPPRSSNRQTVVSTGSGLSDLWPNEPTTPSSATDTKRSFHAVTIGGAGLTVGDDPFAREPLCLAKDSPAPSLSSFPNPPLRHPRTATGSPSLHPDPGPSRHLHPPVSPKSSTLLLSPRSSRPSSPNRSRSTSASSSLNPPSVGKSPRTPPPFISSVSPADMHAHAVAAEHPWGPDDMAIYDSGPDVDIRSRHFEPDSRHAHEVHRPDDVPSIRRGQSAHAVLASGSSSRSPRTPRLLHSASSSHLSSYSQSPPTNTLLPPPLLSPTSHHTGRAGSSATSEMGSMTALASGIVQRLEDESTGSDRRRGPPKRPSKSLLRERCVLILFLSLFIQVPSQAIFASTGHCTPVEVQRLFASGPWYLCLPDYEPAFSPIPLSHRASRCRFMPSTLTASTSSLANHVQPPRRKESLNALQGSTSPASVALSLEPVPRSPSSLLESLPRSPESANRLLEPPLSPERAIRLLEPSAARSPESTSPPRPRTASSPSRPQTHTYSHTHAHTRSRPPTSPSRHRTFTSPSSPPARYGVPPSPGGFSPPSSLFPHSPPASLFPHGSPPTHFTTHPNSLHSPPSSPPARLTFSSPAERLSEDTEDLDNYHFAIAPAIQEADAQSIGFSDFGYALNEDEDVWSDDGMAFHHAGPLSNRRPPPSPTNLPFMAGNAGRRARHDLVYPSGVHTIPMSDLANLRGLATLGEDIPVGKEEDAVVGRSNGDAVEGGVGGHSSIDLDTSSKEYTPSTQDETPTGSSPSPVNVLERIPSASTGTSSCSSIAPEAVPPRTVSSRIEFSRHARTESHSDSELDLDSFRIKPKPRPTRHHQQQHVKSTQTAIAWRCGSGNHEKCCATRSLQEGHNTGQFKCCAERTPSGKVARCCASFNGMPCERARVSSTSSASVSDLKRQRSLHFPGLPSSTGAASHCTPANLGGGKRSRGFFRPHTSHGKSTSSALMDDDLKAMIVQCKPSREDPGPTTTSSSSEATVTGAGMGTGTGTTLEGSGPVSVASPPMSPVAKQEFQTRPIISPSKLNDHLKETLEAVAPSSTPDPIKSPVLGPVRGRSDTTTTVRSATTTATTATTATTTTTGTGTGTDTSGSASVRSVLTNQSDDSPAPMKKLFPPRPRRNQNVSLPTMTTSTQAVLPPRRYVQSITPVLQPPGATRPAMPPPRSPISGFGLSSLSSGQPAFSIGALDGLSPGVNAGAGNGTGTGLPPPPRAVHGRTNAQPIVSFISSRSAPTHTLPPNVGLRHSSSRESYESSRTVRRERSIPLLREMSFLEFEEGVSEEDEEDLVESRQQEQEQQQRAEWTRPTLHQTQSFLDLSSRQSGDTMRENMAMFS
ncbi:hypothetical protein RHS04_02004 [Rhizoctonia solani]|uniref:Uncharacterized protein n=1 Tax=Rhizoctonia solani TaxID=456999 RepID=A0A8H7LQM9_9AGAM|nr:hypothetical protein RHS04_02004 [Rhizoctonia solani]